MHFVFDLDGTIVDHRARTYGLHVRYCAENSYIPVPLAEYIAKKSEGASERQTVRDSIPVDEMDRYMAWKRVHIESDESLALDTLWPGMVDLLGQLRGRDTLILLTSRQSESQAIKELQGLGIAHMFSAIIAAPNDGRPASKLDALKPYLDQHGVEPAQIVLIGDTECEIAVARALKAACLSVTWGVRGSTFLAALHPDGIAGSVSELGDMLRADSAKHSMCRPSA
jgi:phosphoglycolate phosphatase-like HAD superfamily hydrolase